MSRDLKFRIWDKEQKQMNYPQSYVLDNTWFGVTTEYYLDDSGTEEYPISEKYYAVMEYSGLNDKNGKPIYEGDCYQKGNVVEFSFGSFNINGDTPLSAICSRIEIIGNIYENPELR